MSKARDAQKLIAETQYLRILTREEPGLDETIDSWSVPRRTFPKERGNWEGFKVRGIIFRYRWFEMRLAQNSEPPVFELEEAENPYEETVRNFDTDSEEGEL